MSFLPLTYLDPSHLSPKRNLCLIFEKGGLNWGLRVFYSHCPTLPNPADQGMGISTPYVVTAPV
jgi:hypothetical protein